MNKIMSKESPPAYSSTDAMRKQEEAQPPLIVSEDETRLAGRPASTVNLLKTIIGSGILGLPLAIKQFGYVPGLALMTMAALLAATGLHLLTVASMHIGRKSSFLGLCHLTYPKAAFVFEAAIAVKCIGAAIVYLSVIGNTSVKLAKLLITVPVSDDTLTSTPTPTSIFASKRFWVFVWATVITPVCLMRKMDSLKYTSFVGLAAVIYLVALTVWNYFRIDTSTVQLVAFAAPSMAMLRSYGAFIFAFTCHQNILSIQNEARRNSPQSMGKIVTTSMSASMVLYVLVAMFGYATYGDKVEDNIIDSFPLDAAPFIVARCLYIVLLLFSYPLQVFPCRNSIEKMCLTVSAEMAARQSRLIYFVASFGIIILTATVASITFPLKFALDIVGATAGTFLCYLLPAIIYNKLYSGQPIDARRIGAFVLMGAGAVTLVVTLAGLLLPK